MNQPLASPTALFSQPIARLRALTQVNLQSGWRYWEGDLPVSKALQTDYWQDWTPADRNAKDHLAWAGRRVVRWFSQRIVVPPALQAYPIAGLCCRLALLWWAREAQVFVNGELVQEGDIFDCAPRLLLSPSVAIGDEFAIALRLVSPGHDDGALMRSVCDYEVADLEAVPEPAFVASELEVLQIYVTTFAPEKLDAIAAAVQQLDWARVSERSAFDRSLAHLRQMLLPLSDFLKRRTLALVGHAHLDMAWLWTVAETWKATERTFESVLALQRDFPELTFCHSTPALYDWVEHQLPGLYDRLRQAIDAGTWEVVGAMWIEPEMNLVGGEAIVRQILYGQRYLQRAFGRHNQIAWLPDTFGFNWQLPQFLQLGGIDYFVTQKLRWNDTTQFPHALFGWQAPNGSQVLSLMSAPIGEGIDPVKIATYACEWEQKTGIQEALWLPGVGDHGGGPTRDMLEVARRWQRSPFFPQLRFTTALDYLQHLEVGVRSSRAQAQNSELQAQSPEIQAQNSESQARSSELQAQNSINQAQSSELQAQNSESQAQNSEAALPIWNDELYLEFHRGCYTTHADQKQANRLNESLLHQAELWASLATIATGATYPKLAIETAWKSLLFNQFHDILPGSSIRDVFVEANQMWQQVEDTARQVQSDACRTIARQIQLPPAPQPNAQAIVVFNSLNWTRSMTCTLSLEPGAELPAIEFPAWEVRHLDGTQVQAQFWSQPGALSGSLQVTFLAAAVPAVGYRCFWLCPVASASKPGSEPATESAFFLENEFLRVTIDPATGDLSSIFDKQQQREVLSGAGNQLQAFVDQGQYWDAWNIDPDYAQHRLPPAELLSIRSQASSEHPTGLHPTVRVDRKIGQSILQQTYSLPSGSPLLRVDTFCPNWQERHVLLKVAFPLNLSADRATYEIPCGAITRPTKPGNDREAAQWEVPALRWADLGDGTYGVSLLTDYKHGFDSQPQQLRLTLLRGAEFPDPEADQGEHRFTYALYPHAGTWQTAQTVRHARELATLPTVVVQPDRPMSPETLPPVASLLNLGADNLILMALKPAEDADSEWVLRIYEAHGEPALLQLNSNVSLQITESIDLLEQSLSPFALPQIKDQGQTVTVHPWQIMSFKVAVANCDK